MIYYVVDHRWTYLTRVPCRWPITSWRRPGTMPLDKWTPTTRVKCAKSATRIASAARRNCGGTRETSTAPTRTCRVTCPAAAGGFSRRPCPPTISRTTLTAVTAVSAHPRTTVRRQTAATTSATGRRWLANSAAGCPLTGQRTPSTWTRHTPRPGPPCAASVTRTRATCDRSSTTCSAGTSPKWRPRRRRRSANPNRSGSVADGRYGAPCAARGTATIARCALTGGCTASSPTTTTSSRLTRSGPVSPVYPQRSAVVVVRCTHSRVHNMQFIGAS